MDEAIAVGPLAERLEPSFDEVEGTLEKSCLLRIEPHAVAPRAPMLHGSERAIEIPSQALEILWPRPGLRMPMHARRHRP